MSNKKGEKFAVGDKVKTNQHYANMFLGEFIDNLTVNKIEYMPRNKYGVGGGYSCNCGKFVIHEDFLQIHKERK